MSIQLTLRKLFGWAFEPIELLIVNRKLMQRISQWETDPAFADIRALDEGQLNTYLESEWTRAKELDEKLYKLTAALSVAVTVGGVLAKTIVDGLAPTIMKVAIEVSLFASMAMFLLGAIIGLSGLRPKVRYGYGASFLKIVAEGGEQAKKAMMHAASGFQIMNLMRVNEAATAIGLVRNGILAFTIAIAASFCAPVVVQEQPATAKLQTKADAPPLEKPAANRGPNISAE